MDEGTPCVPTYCSLSVPWGPGDGAHACVSTWPGFSAASSARMRATTCEKPLAHIWPSCCVRLSTEGRSGRNAGHGPGAHAVAAQGKIPCPALPGWEDPATQAVWGGPAMAHASATQHPCSLGVSPHHKQDPALTFLFLSQI